jgi:hypothetical protein
MKVGHAIRAKPKQRARQRVPDRAGVFGVQADDNMMLMPVAIVLLFVLSIAAPLVAAIGLAIFASSSALRSASLRWLDAQLNEDLAERNECAVAVANEYKNVLISDAHNTVSAVCMLQTLPPAHFVSGRIIAFIELTPRLISFFTTHIARITRAAAA